MSASENQSTEKLAEGFTRTWRYKVGLFMIVGGHVILLIGLVLPFLGMSAAISGAVILGGEVTALASIVFLGKEGFKAIKAKMFGAVKASYTAQVGRTRHFIGIILLCANALTTYTSSDYHRVLLVVEMAKGPPEIRFSAISHWSGVETIEKARGQTR